jgi:hypothetical protein
MLRPTLLGILICCSFACNGKDTTEEEEDTSGGFFPETDDNNNSPECSDDGVSPCIEDIEAWCYENTVGASSFFWQVIIEADDPQGDDTIDEGTVTVTKDGNTVHEALIVCNDSDCFGTWNASSTSPTMGCSADSAAGYTFKAVILDEDGNVSDGAATVGYLGYQ